MFEIGERYNITMYEPGPEGGDHVTLYNWVVEEVDMPVVKLRGHDGEEWILNVSSSGFISAKRQP